MMMVRDHNALCRTKYRLLSQIKHTNGPTGNVFVRPTGIGVTPEARVGQSLAGCAV